MKFFKNKVNIILTIVLVLLIGIGVVLGLKFFEKPNVKVIDFTNMYEDEIVKWTIENEVQDLFEYKHEYDDVIESGKVIYQSLKEGDEITDNVLIIISDGKDMTDYIEIPIDTIKTEDDFIKWAENNNITNIKYDYDNESDKQEGTIISIEPEAIKKEDLITVKIASNKNIDVPDFSYMSEKEISKWAKDNDVKVTYGYETSNQKKDSFIKQSVKAGDKVASGSSIIITLSKGNNADDKTSAYIDETKYLGEKEETFVNALKELGFKNVVKIGEVKSTKYKEGTICYYLPDGRQSLSTKIEYKVSSGEKEPSDVKEAYIDETKYLGYKEEDFLKALKELGFTNVVKKEEVSSSKYKEGTICYYLPDGKQKTDTKIEYKVVKSSDFVKTVYIDETKYLGYKEEDFLKALKDLGFTNVVKKEETTSTKYTEGTICYYLPDGYQKTDAKIEYKVVKSSGESTKTAYINETKYLGYKEEDFLKALKDLGFTNIVKKEEVTSTKYKEGTICYYLPDGNQKLDTKIEYKVVKASSTPESKTAYIDPTKYLGKTEKDFLQALMGLGFSDITKIDEIYSDSYSEGTICYYMPDGTQNLDKTITYKVSMGKKPQSDTYADIMSFKKIESMFNSDSYDETKESVNEYLSEAGFTNITIKPVSAAKSVGYIVSISVNGSSSYTEGSYKTTTPIVVEICNKDTSNS